MTSNPDDIPQDVRDAAKAAYVNFARERQGAPGQRPVGSAWAAYDMVEFCSRAIMAERERCAKVSEAFGAAIAIAGPSGEYLSIVPYVAGAIRSGLPSEKVSQDGVWRLAPGGGFVIADKGWDRQAKLTPEKA